LLGGALNTFETWKNLFKVISKIENALHNARSNSLTDKEVVLKKEFNSAKNVKKDFEIQLIDHLNQFIDNYKDLNVIKSINHLFEEHIRKVSIMK